MLLIRNFRGMRPRLNPLLLQSGEATRCVDASFRDGTLRPMNGPAHTQRVTNTDDRGIAVYRGRVRTFPGPVYQQSLGSRTVLTGGITADGTSDPPMYFRGDDIIGATLHKLGVPRPETAPTAAVTVAGTNPADILFAYAYANRDGDVGDLSDTVIARVGVNGTVRLTGLEPFPNDEGYDDEGAKILVYRTSFENRSFFLVGEIDAANSQHDVEMDSPLGLPKRLYSALTHPPADLRRIYPHPNGFWFSYSGDTVRMSEIEDVSTWPVEYSFRAPRDIVGLGINRDVMYVFPREESPLMLSAVGPDRLQRSETEIQWPCVSGDSIVNTGYGLFYASRNGIVALVGRGGQLVTREHLDPRTWNGFNPERLRAYVIDGVYYGYGNGRSFMLDTQSAGNLDMTLTSNNPTDVKVENGIAYGVREDAVWRYEQDAENLRQFEWESGLMRASFPRTIGAMQVRADYGTRSYQEGVGGVGDHAIGDAAVGDPHLTFARRHVRPQISVTIEDEFGNLLFHSEMTTNRSIPVGLTRKTDTFALRLSSNVPVHSVALADTHQQLRELQS